MKNADKLLVVKDDATPNSAPQADTEALAPLRERIDQIDADLVRLLNERAQVVVEVGRIKRDEGGAIYVPHRERAVMQRIRDLSEGPLPDRCLEAIWRELMSGSFALERPLRIGYLGPAGSFSHEAAEAKFGMSVEYDNMQNFKDIFDEVQRGHLDYGVVPVENTLHGAVPETLDLLGQGGVLACAEIKLRIRHNLLSHCDAPQIKRIYSHPVALGQCRQWLYAQFPKVEQMPTSSTSRAAEMAATEEGTAAVGSLLAAKLYGLRVQFEDISDRIDNTTRFYVIGQQQTRPSGDDKTSITFVVGHKPGALVEVLDVFKRHDLNMTHIDKRPIQAQPWEYQFHVDLLGHRDEPAVAAALEEAAQHCQVLRVLGSFPRAGEPVNAG